MTRMTGEEIVSILDVVPDDAEPFELAPGRTVPVAGVSVDAYVSGLVRRFPSLRSQFTMGAKAELARLAGEDEGAFDAVAYIDAQIDTGPEARAAFAAAGLGHLGNAAVEAALLRLPTERFQALIDTVGRKTWGSDPARFFGLVGQVLAGLQAAAMAPTSTTQAS